MMIMGANLSLGCSLSCANEKGNITGANNTVTEISEMKKARFIGLRGILTEGRKWRRTIWKIEIAANKNSQCIKLNSKRQIRKVNPGIIAGTFF